MSGNPPPVVTARLRSRVTVNATWYMYYEAPIQMGQVQFTLYNSVSKIDSSPLYQETGPAINHVWSFYLDPGEWSMQGRREQGKVVIILAKFDGVSYAEDRHEYPIMVYPEELSCAFTSLYLGNDSTGRMDCLNATYLVTSVQDPTFHHAGLGFTRTITNDRDEVLAQDDLFVNSGGVLDVYIEKSFLIYLENFSFTLQNHDSLRLELVFIEQPLAGLINRTGLLVACTNITEAVGDNGTALDAHFEIHARWNATCEANRSLYATWQLVLSNGTVLDQGFQFVSLGTGFTITIEPSQVQFLESLTLDAWIEGTYEYTSASCTVDIASKIDRDAIRIEQAGYLDDHETGQGIMSFLLIQEVNSSAIPMHQARVQVAYRANDSVVLDSWEVSDGNGTVKAILSQAILDQLESFVLMIQAIPDLHFTGATMTAILADEFHRDEPVIAPRNDTTALVLEKGKINTIELAITINGSSAAILSRFPATIVIVNASDNPIYHETAIIDPRGIVVLELPVDLLPARQWLTFLVSLNATFEHKPARFSTPMLISRIIDPQAILARQVITIFSIVAVAGIGSLLTMIVWKKVKKPLLSKKDFTISVN